MNNLNVKQQLLEGKTVECRPKGNSMVPYIRSGQLVEIVPLTKNLAEKEIVFCKVRGRYYLHLITAVKGDLYQISNARGHVNGWTHRNNIYGVVKTVEAK